MIDRATLDRLIADLQAAASAYDEVDAVVAKRDKAKTEHDVVARELKQFQLALSDLKLEYQDKRQELGKLMADIVRRTTELQKIDAAIGQAKQRAFGG
jgi:hypothetical protein